MRKFVTLVGVCVLLVGCADQQEKLAQQDLAANNARCRAGKVSINTAILREKISLNHKARTAAMMAIDAVPNDEEKTELQKLVTAEQTCQSDSMQWMARYRTVYAAPQGRYFVAFDNVLLDLMVGKISFGEANRKLAVVEIQYQAESTDAGLKEQQRQEREATLQGISSAVEDNASAVRSIPAPTPPAPMTFPAFPKQCHTVVSGNFVQTQCY